jgi:hypothetical protein
LQSIDTSIIFLVVILEILSIFINAGYVFGLGMTVSVDNAIISVIISAAVSFGIFGLKEKWIEPRRWRRSAEAIKLEKKLEVYGALTTLLESFYHKGQRINVHKGIQDPSHSYEHALELPFDADKLDEIFERSRYLLSDDLITKYMEYVKQDTYHSIFQARKGGEPQVVLVDLKEMQTASENEFGHLNKKYKELMGFPA